MFAREGARAARQAGPALGSAAAHLRAVIGAVPIAVHAAAALAHRAAVLVSVRVSVLGRQDLGPDRAPSSDRIDDRIMQHRPNLVNGRVLA
jgi:hypothetical protein